MLFIAFLTFIYSNSKNTVLFEEIKIASDNH